MGMGGHTLPQLPYAYDALEPAIRKEIMTLHHSKHHQTYVNGLNAAEEAYANAIQANNVPKQIELQAAIKFNGGGHINHSLFWKNLAPTNSNETKLKKKFNAATAAIQGSGWGWLGADKAGGRLQIYQTKDQDPLTTVNPNLIPVLGVDIWEHAFYLQYKNVKPDYLNAIWSVINFDEADRRYTSGEAGTSKL